MNNIPKLYQVYPIDGFKVVLYYDNGEIKLFDCGIIIKQGGIFDIISDIGIFKELCTIMNGTLAFDISKTRDPYNCIDICPDTIYCQSAVCQDLVVA